jgi:hypothetical protein
VLGELTRRPPVLLRGVAENFTATTTTISARTTTAMSTNSQTEMGVSDHSSATLSLNVGLSGKSKAAAIANDGCVRYTLEKLYYLLCSAAATAWFSLFVERASVTQVRTCWPADI